MAPTRRSARTKAESTEDRVGKAAKPPTTRASGRSKAATKNIVEKNVKKSTRSRRVATPEEEEEKDEAEEENAKIPEADKISVVRNHIKLRATPTSTIASLTSPPKAKATRGRVNKKSVTGPQKEKATKVTTPVSKEIVDAGKVAITPGPATRRSTRGNRAVSEAPADHITTETPAAERSKHEGRKINPENFTVVENSAAANATPHWAKKRGKKVIQDASMQSGEVAGTVAQEAADIGTELEKPTKKGKKKAVVSKKGKGKAETDEKKPEIGETGANSAAKESAPVIEEPIIQSADPIITDHEVANDKPEPASPPKRSSRTRTVKAVKRRAIKRPGGKSARGKKASEVGAEEEATQPDEVAGDTSMVDSQPSAKLVKKGASKEIKGKKVVSGPASEVSEATQLDDTPMEGATQSSEIHDAQLNGPRVTKPVVDSGIFDVESVLDTKEKPEVIFEQENDLEMVEQRPGEKIETDAKEPEDHGGDVKVDEGDSAVIKGDPKKEKKAKKSKGKGKKAMEVVVEEDEEEAVVSEVQNEVEESVTESKVEEPVNVSIDVESEKKVEIESSGSTTENKDFAPEKKIIADKSEVAIEHTTEAESQQVGVAKIRKVKPKKKSTATKKKERAAAATAAKKAKTQLQPEVDADGDMTIDAEKDAEDGYNKSVASSSRIVDPAVVLGPKRAGVRKASPKKNPVVKGVRRGRSAAITGLGVAEVGTVVGGDDVKAGQNEDAGPGAITKGELPEKESEVVEVDNNAELDSTVLGGEPIGQAVVGEVVIGREIHEEISDEIMRRTPGEDAGAHNEEEDVVLPMSRSSIILSPTRFTSPNPDLDPIKSSVPSSPITRSVSQQLHSSPLCSTSKEPILASPGPTTTPRASPIKKWVTPNTHTSGRLSQSGTPYGKNLEDSRDIGRSNSTPTRALNVDFHSSPVMMPPPTPNVVAGDGRSPVKQTPTKGSVAGDVTLGNLEVNLEAGRQEDGENVTSSPIKNPTPIKAETPLHSSPAGRLSLVGGLSSPVVGRLEHEIPLLSSPTVSSPSKSSPIKKTKLDFLKNVKTPMLSSSPSRQSASDNEDDENVGDDTFAGRDSFRDIEDLVGGFDEGADEEEISEVSIHQAVYDEAEEKETAIASNMLPESEEHESELDDSRSSNIDESRLFKLLGKAQKAVQEEKGPASVEAEEEAGEEDIAECDLTFTAPGDLSNEDTPSSPLDESPLKLQEFTYEPTASIFPPRTDKGDEKKQSGEEGNDEETEVFSPVMIFDNTFDQSAANWKEDDEESEEEGETDWDEEQEEGKGISFHLDPESTGGRLQAFRASSPPNFWRAQEAKATASPSPTSPITYGHPGDDTDFDRSYARGLNEEENEDEKAPGSSVDDSFEQSFARGVDMDRLGSEQEYEDINLLPNEEVGEDTQFEMSFLQGVEEEREEIRKQREAGERREKMAKGRKRFLEAEENARAIKMSRGNNGRRHTYNPGEQKAKQEGGGRRLSGGAPPNRQFYLERSRPDDVQINWTEHIKRVAEERVAAAKIQKAYRAYRVAAKGAETPVEVPVIAKGSALHQAPIRPSMVPGRRLRYASPSPSSVPASPPANGRMERKAIDTIGGGRVGKSNIPLSRGIPAPRKAIVGEGKMVGRHTSQNGLYSIGIKFQLVRKDYPRPTEAALEATAHKAVQEAKEKRKVLMERAGCWLHPGEEEEWVPTEKEGDRMRIRWDPQLVYICGEETGISAEGSKAPVHGILKVPPPLTAHGNWIPVANAPPLELPREFVEVSKVVYLGEDHPKDPVPGKEKRK